VPLENTIGIRMPGMPQPTNNPQVNNTVAAPTATAAVTVHTRACIRISP
jgi:hypothetical protein